MSDYTGGTTATDTDAKVKLDPESKATLALTGYVDVPVELREQLEGWLATYIPHLQAKRDKALKERIAKCHRTLNGERSTPPFRPGASNLSVPLILWAAAAIRARVRLGVLEQGKVFSVAPLKSRSFDGVDLNRVSTSLGRCLEVAFNSPRWLAGKQAIDRSIKSSTDDGAAGYTLYEEPVLPRYVMNREGVMELKASHPRLRTEYLYGLDILMPEGYGTDTQCAPLVGYEFDQSWHDMKSYEAGKHYYPDTLTAVAQHLNIPETEMPAKLNTHRLAHLYLGFWIAESDKMAYKARFRPLEGLTAEGWQLLPNECA